MMSGSKRFRVALSFPGEHRPFLEKVAARLATELGRDRVLYDAYHEAEFARPNLDTHLQGLYHDQSDLIAVFFCEDYERKEWCGLEWRAIRDLIKKREDETVMPFRFDMAEIPGIFSIDGYSWIGDRTPDQVVDLILQRLRPRGATADPPPPGGRRVEPSRLSHATDRLFGRETELETLGSQRAAPAQLAARGPKQIEGATMNGERLLPPSDSMVFESLCLDLWRDIWNDPGAQKNGRSGQRQAGVDIFGQVSGVWAGVQCKQKDDLLRTKVTVTELEAEIRKARTFEPHLDRFLLATTGPRDAKVQKRARELSENGFRIEVWSWPDIWHEIRTREQLLGRIYPIYWPTQARASQCLQRGETLGALELWQEKLAFLETQLPMTVDPDQKFRLQQLIKDALEQIRRLSLG